MLHNLDPTALVLLVFTALGVISHNAPVTIAGAVLLLMQQTFLVRYLPWVEKNGLTVGIILLTIGVLAPLASGKITLGWTLLFLIPFTLTFGTHQSLHLIAHAMIGGCFLPTHHVSTRTISVCVELRMAASPPGNR